MTPKLVSRLIAVGTLALTSQLGAQEALIAFKLAGGADLDESSKLTATTVIHPGLTLRSGLAIGIPQRRDNQPGLIARKSNTLWSFAGVGSGSGAGDDTEANSLAAAIRSNCYISFTVAPSEGKALDLSAAALKVHYGFKNGGRQAGPTQSALLSSVGGFTETASLASSSQLNNQVATYPIAGPGLDRISAPVEFRIYFWREDGNGINASGGSLVMDSAIPEAPGGNVVLLGQVVAR